MFSCVTVEDCFCNNSYNPSPSLLAIKQSSDPKGNVSSTLKRNPFKAKYLWLRLIKVTSDSLVSLIGIHVLFNTSKTKNIYSFPDLTNTPVLATLSSCQNGGTSSKGKKEEKQVLTFLFKYFKLIYVSTLITMNHAYF